MDRGTDRLNSAALPRAPVQSARPGERVRDPEAGTRFARELEARGKALADGGAFLGSMARLGRGEGRSSGLALIERDPSEHEPEMTLASAAGPILREAAPAPTPAPAPAAPPADPMIDRMAAAIAELSTRAGSDTLRVDFASGALAEGALVVRDAQSGALSIRIVGMIAGISEKRRVEAEHDLRLGLEKRGLSADLSFGHSQASLSVPMARG